MSKLQSPESDLSLIDVSDRSPQSIRYRFEKIERVFAR